MVFYSRHEERDYKEVIDYGSDDLILDGYPIEEEDDVEDMEDFIDEDEEDYIDDEEEGEPHLQNFYPNGTVIKFKCSQTKPSQYASWQIRYNYFRNIFSNPKTSLELLNVHLSVHPKHYLGIIDFN